MQHPFRTRILRGAAATALAIAGAAQAQTPAPAASAAAADDQLEEITVTARRTEERLQDTPVSVTAVTAETLDRLNVRQVSDVAQVVPNLVLMQGGTGPTNATVFIRGIGGYETLLTVDSPVGVYLDGVYLGRANALNTDLVDLARIEVLRGPQGTLFGRNTSAGAVNLVSRAPDDELGVRLASGWGDERGWYARAQLDTGELGDSGLRAMLSYMRSARDGYLDNPAAPDKRDPSARRGDAVYAKLVGDWGGFTAEYAFDWNRIRGQQQGFQLVAVAARQQAYFGGSAALGGAPLILSDDRIGTLALGTTGTIRDEQLSDVKGHALTLTYAASDAITLKSISSARRWEAEQPTRFGPLFRGPVNSGGVISIQNTELFSGDLDNDQDQRSQELQLLLKTERWSGVAGLYYFDEDVAVDNPTYLTFVTATTNPAFPLVGLNLAQRVRYRGSSHSYAAFGQATYTPPILDDQLAITAGIRRTRDKRSIFTFNVGAPTRSAESVYHDTSYNLSVDYHLGPDVLTFARVATGYRAGGFNARVNSPTAPIDFFPEKATTYEAGIKADALDRRLRTNATLFYTDYRDFQVAQFTGGNGTTTNADATYKGGEVEIQALPARGLTLSASLGYTDAGFDYYPYSNPVTNLLENYASIARMPYVAKWTTHVGAQYEFAETAIGRPLARVDFSTQSRRFFHSTNLSNANPFNEQIVDPGRELLSARLVLADIPLGGRATAELQLYGENLLNDELVDSGIDFGTLGFAGLFYGPPRGFGLDLKIRY